MRGTRGSERAFFLVFLVITDTCVKINESAQSDALRFSMFALRKNQISAHKISEAINRFASIIKMTVN